MASPPILDPGLPGAQPIQIGHFTVLSTLGEGGMGVVYAARDNKLGRKVAIKIMHAATNDETRGRARMLREAQAMARMSHPNVVQVYEVGEYGNQIYVAMEFVKGQTLRRWQREHTHSWREILDRYIEAGRGLAAAHKKGLVHCDFKPHNVLVDDEEGRVRVSDFGLARTYQQQQSAVPGPRRMTAVADVTRDSLEQSMSVSDTLTGTPAYMSPEQYQGQRATALSDQFSFAVALYEALYGERPFSGQNPAALAFQVSAGELRDPPANAKVPSWLRQVIIRGLAPEPGDRWPSMDAMLSALVRDTGAARRYRVRIEGINIERFKLLSSAGYDQVKPLRDGQTTVVYRGVRGADHRAVLIKLLRNELPSPGELARLRREREILGRFDVAGIPRPLALDPHGRGLVLVLEDLGGQSLRQLIAETGGLEIDEFLRFGREIVETLAQVHAAGVVHKDICPDHILVDRGRGVAAIMDFDVASVISEEAPTVVDPDQLEGTLHYIAPEQTGRMNRKVDYRSDYYALGVTFYEAITGQLPFEVSHPMELVHCHIARAPTPPSEVSANVPEALSRIVLKLMAKTAEERYQSARGLLADLDRCAKEWEQHGWIEDFEPGQRDSWDQFKIPQKLYGRERSVHLLMAAFERAAAGSTELMLISGPSGIGKSAVVREVHKPIVARRGYFVAGKSDPLGRDVPYTALIQAFQDLFRQILREPDDALARWREDLVAALGDQAQILIDVVPELELVIGAQPPVPTLPPTESANRFRTLVRNLVFVFASEEHPLVLFLDDLQWSDLASLKLIEQLVVEQDLAHLLILGTYRDHEVGPDHLVRQVVRAVEEARRPVSQLTLGPLDVEHTLALVHDTLRPTVRDPEPLARLVQSKTEGNPFFVRALLRTLHADGMIFFDHERDAWSWDEEAVAGARMSEDVVELMSSRIGELPDVTIGALELASCIGNQFTLALLATVARRGPRRLARELWPAIERGLIQAIGDAYKYIDAEGDDDDDDLPAPEDIHYKFAHDKIQHAAYRRLPGTVRQETHLRIGRLLLERAGDQDLGDKLFTVAAHLGVGAPLITAPPERLRIARLNLLAGHRAKLAIAYDSAVTHLRGGIELLPDDGWERHYELTFALHRELMEATHLGGDIDGALLLFQPLVDRARTDLEKAQIYELKITLETYRKQNKLAVRTAVEGLAVLGMRLPTRATPARVLLELVRVRLALGLRSIAELKDTRELADPRKRLLLRLMAAVVPAAYFIDTTLASLILLMSARITLRDGVTEDSAFGVAGWGLVVSGGLGRHEDAYEIGQVALQLNERFPNPWLEVKVNFIVGLFISTWIEPFAAARRRLHTGYQSGIQRGDLAFALYNGVMITLISLMEGQNIDRVEGLVESMKPTARRAGEIDGIAMLTSVQRFCMALRGQTLSPTAFSTVDWREEDFAAGLSDHETPQAIFFYHLHRVMLLYLFGAYEEAERFAGEVERRLEAALAQPALADFAFYQALIAAARHGEARGGGRRRIERLLAGNIRKLARWAEYCPNNFRPRLLLVQAERARVLGARGAFVLYNQAIQAAREHESIICEAIALELTARYSLDAGYDVAVESYVSAACDAYRRLGARAKVDVLSQEFGDHLPLLALPAGDSGSSSSSPELAQVADVEAFNRAFQAIASEVSLEGLLANVTRTLTELTGARRCVVLLSINGELRIEAEGGLSPQRLHLGQAAPLDDYAGASVGIIKYVARTREPVLLNRAHVEGDFTDDPYVVRSGVKSVLCTPMIHQHALAGVIYLENELSPDVFRHEQVALLGQLLSPVAVALMAARRAASFRRFVPQRVLDRIGGGPQRELKPGDHVTLHATALHVELRSTAGRGEPTPASVAQLNSLVARSEAIAEQFDGFIAERTGAAVLVLFPGPAEDALSAALELLQFVDQQRASHREPSRLDAALALHAGAVTLIAVGTDQELAVVSVSETVEVTRRLGRLTGRYGAALVLSESVRVQLPSPPGVQLVEIDRLEVGDGPPLTIHEVTQERG